MVIPFQTPLGAGLDWLWSGGDMLDGAAANGECDEHPCHARPLSEPRASTTAMERVATMTTRLKRSTEFERFIASPL